MDIFNYHPITGEYLSAGTADENPLGAADPIVPGYATPTVPPVAPKGMVVVYRSAKGAPPQNWPEGSWMAVRDYRGVPLYRTVDGSRYLFDGEYAGLGDLPSELTDVPRPSEAHIWEDGAWHLDESLEAQRLGAEAESKRRMLLEDADAQIAPLMDGFVLGELSEAEQQRLRQLSLYRKALRAVDTTNPRAIAWPDAPA